jgi:hypothetical protein
MNYSEPAPPSSAVPEIVQIVLTQAAKFRAAGRIDQQKFEAQINRLCAEELQPRGWSLATQERNDGATQFLIRSSAGVVDLIDCTPRN